MITRDLTELRGIPSPPRASHELTYRSRASRKGKMVGEVSTSFGRLTLQKAAAHDQKRATKEGRSLTLPSARRFFNLLLLLVLYEGHTWEDNCFVFSHEDINRGLPSLRLSLELCSIGPHPNTLTTQPISPSLTRENLHD